MPKSQDRSAAALIVVDAVLAAPKRGRGPLSRSPLSPLLPAQSVRYVVPGRKVDPVKVAVILAPILAILLAAGAALCNLLGWDAPQIRFVLLWPILLAVAVGLGAVMLLRFRKP